MITCLLSFAEFEGATIKERTQRGREAARLIKRVGQRNSRQSI